MVQLKKVVCIQENNGLPMSPPSRPGTNSSVEAGGGFDYYADMFFKLKTDAILRPETVMTIYRDGNIGIGTSTPGAKLEVVGAIKAIDISATDISGVDGFNTLYTRTLNVDDSIITNRITSATSTLGEADALNLQVTNGNVDSIG